MKLKLQVEICLVVLMAVIIIGGVQSSHADERTLWDLWCAGTNSAFLATTVIDSCKAFKIQSPKDPLTTVVSGFEAWNYLKSGNTAAATTLFNSMLVKGDATDIERAGDFMARSWLTRMDREIVIRALKKIYLQNIEYPPSLEPLKSLEKIPALPLNDRWGKPWVYTLGSTIKGMSNQRYTLESSTLGAYSDLKTALKMPYAEKIDLQPVRMAKSSRVAGNVVEFQSSTGLSVLRQAGDQANRVNLAYLGERIIVLSDGNHWSVMAKPR